jgi:uncharacterized coiled-coil protein SlyX
MVCVSGWSLENQLLIRLCRERFETMPDMIRTVLVEQKMRYEERIEQLINERNNQEDFIKSLLKTIADQGVMIDNLRKDLDGMSRVNKTMGDVIWKDTHV